MADSPDELSETPEGGERKSPLAPEATSAGRSEGKIRLFAKIQAKMTYDYKCDNCDHQWDTSLPMDMRDTPLSKECPACSHLGRVRRIITKAPTLTGDTKDPIRRAGSGWNDVLGKVKKASGRANTIRTV